MLSEGFAALIALLGVAQADLGQTSTFVLTGTGRFAVFADTTSIQREGDLVRMRAFQVVEPSFTAGDAAYWGGWSWWAFDCAARTADRLDFASVREGGVEGPAMADDAPPYEAAPGGDAAELLAVACGATVTAPDATTLEEAVRIGRAALAEWIRASAPAVSPGRDV